MKTKCIYCNKEFKADWGWRICDSCTALKNKHYKKFELSREEYKKLLSECEKWVKQVMTGHSCGLESCIGEGCREHFYSSTCLRCNPKTQQHYGSIAEMIIAWTKNYMQKSIMKNLLLKYKLVKKC